MIASGREHRLCAAKGGDPLWKPHFGYDASLLANAIE